MGKIEGIFQFTGKTGQVVGMKGKNGQNYSRVHVTPNNPKTTAQNIARLKMSLAGQMSKLTDADIIVGMNGAGKVEKRSAFVRNIVRNATSTGFNAQGNATAVLTPENLVLSQGANHDFDTEQVIVNLPHGVRNATVQLKTDVFTESGASKVLVVLYCGKIGEGDIVEFIAAEAEVIDIASAATDVNFDAHGADEVEVYAIPLIAKTADANVYYEQGVINAHGYAAAAQLARSGLYEYAKSQHVGTYQRQ